MGLGLARGGGVLPGRSGGVCGGSLTALAAQWKMHAISSGAWRRLAAWLGLGLGLGLELRLRLGLGLGLGLTRIRAIQG